MDIMRWDVSEMKNVSASKTKQALFFVKYKDDDVFFANTLEDPQKLITALEELHAY